MFKKRYYISFVTKKSSTGNMKCFTVVQCKSKDLFDIINKTIDELRKTDNYEHIYVDTVTKL